MFVYFIIFARTYGRDLAVTSLLFCTGHPLSSCYYNFISYRPNFFFHTTILQYSKLKGSWWYKCMSRTANNFPAGSVQIDGSNLFLIRKLTRTDFDVSMTSCHHYQETSVSALVFLINSATKANLIRKPIFAWTYPISVQTNIENNNIEPLNI